MRDRDPVNAIMRSASAADCGFIPLQTLMISQPAILSAQASAAVDGVADIHEIAGMRAVAIDHDRLAGRRLADEARDDQAIVLAGTVDVEDAKRRRSERVLAYCAAR